MNAAYLIAALGGFTAVFVHGVLGHRWFTRQVRPGLTPTPFGDRDVSRRVHLVSWHVVTVAFAMSGAGMLLLGLGTLESPALARFIATGHALYLGVAAILFHDRLAAILRFWPMVFVTVMTSIATFGWLGSR